MWVKPPKATQNEAKEAFATGGITEPNKDVLTNPLLMRAKVPGNEVMQLQSRSFELTRILGFSDVKWNPKDFQWSPSWWFVATTPWNIKQVNSSKGDAKSWLRSEDGIEVVKLTLGKWKLLPPFLGGRPLLSYSYTNLFMELLFKNQTEFRSSFTPRKYSERISRMHMNTLWCFQVQPLLQPWSSPSFRF